MEAVKDITGIILTPGVPTECSGNGETLDEAGNIIECCCDNCDFFLSCYSEPKQPGRNMDTHC